MKQPKDVSKHNLFLSFIILLVFTTACGGQPEEAQPVALLQTESLESTAVPTQTTTTGPTLVSTQPLPPAFTPTSVSHPHMIAEFGKGIVEDYFVSPDGSIIAYIQGEYLTWVRAADGHQMGSIRLPDKLSPNYYGNILYSPDSSLMVIGAYIDTHLVNTKTGELVDCCVYTMKPQYYFRFSADMNYMAYIISDDSMGRGARPYRYLGVYNIEKDGDIILDTPYENVSYTLGEPAISPDNSMVAVGYHEEGDALELIVWDFRTREIKYHMSYSSDINTVDFSPDGKYLITGADDGYLRFHVPETGEWIRSVGGFSGEITKVRFSEDGTSITVTIRNYADYQYYLLTDQIELIEPELNEDMAAFAASMHQQGWADGSEVKFSPVGNVVAIGGKSIQLWDIDTGNLLVSLDNPYEYLYDWDFNPSGDKIVGQDSSNLMIWDTSSGEKVFNYHKSQKDYSTAFAFSPDGTQLAYRNESQTGIEIWEILTDEIVHTIKFAEAALNISHISFSEDGQRLYVLYNGASYAKVWDIQNEKLLHTYVFPDYIRNSAVSKNLYAYYDQPYSDMNTVKLFDMDTGEKKEFSFPARYISNLTLSPDGSIMMAIVEDRLFIWNTETGASLYKLKLAETYDLYIAINDTNTRFAIGKDGLIQIWDIAGVPGVTGE